MLRPNKLIQKLLISSTSRFVGEYESDELLITHAWPFLRKDMSVGYSENPYSRNYFVVIFKTEEMKSEPEHVKTFPDYSFFGDMICIFLSILFGKRFDNHGLLEINGLYNLPNFNNIAPIYLTGAGPNNHSPRKDLGIELNLSNIRLIQGLLDGSVNKEIIETIYTAGKFYLRSLQIFELEPEIAFIDLVTCGEILSNQLKFSEEELYDGQILEMLKKIESNLDDGESIAKNIRNRLFQVKRKYTFTILKLLNDYFFSNTESKEDFLSLKKEDIGKRVKASYDLRSLYVHTGIQFGHWLSPHSYFLNEIQLGVPVVESKDFEKLLFKSPTYIGLERIIRFSLLRFIHLNALRIDSRLDD
jgi:hypothetical protein